MTEPAPVLRLSSMLNMWLLLLLLLDSVPAKPSCVCVAEASSGHSPGVRGLGHVRVEGPEVARAGRRGHPRGGAV